MNTENTKNQIASEVADKSADKAMLVAANDSQVTEVREPEKKEKDSKFSTNGGVGVQTDDVAAKITIGTGDINKNQNDGSGNNITGSTVNITSNTDNTKHINKNRFDNLPSLPSVDNNAAQLGMNSPER